MEVVRTQQASKERGAFDEAALTGIPTQPMALAVAPHGAAGRCVEAAAGEVGELLGLIDNADVTRRFDGYTDRAATEKKILRDVAAVGDLYFSTGDLVRQDAEGFVYFVAEILSAAPGVSESTVYGVSVGSLEGRAGMAALVVEAAASALRRWPRPWRPYPELTATFKIRKGKLVEQGFDPAVVSDVWLYEEAAGAYRPLDVELHRRLVSGQVKL
ncbi:hypothetical protein EMIHUDRAFT_108879 [Emiliania huxleyi CCMP1516]|uniref:Uncharacterized protein n=2 Tax=Emiliania huxleyi TaxID=2903 RepID=A0A0D3KU94_EMIH1|nr:hypothetical protein EMIHUDRAFT_118183 [Emiliania huxleyi CCMP1516]XP_005791758.1 hypothetical protein EMIHUDRAFT_108879 [Emiliania huxleyi CCMP1516]EOD19085.1 hypothetical protein EMIHUDRAFT_118183 [Emiliania huxleyi CCMP1516]EOD39329.1 hypothetical protein EMIHUDRAFT_108879 [Emiliania huxleyi CCMP1516]|eukprot:XP_005771514.1 hypothetical protein EMIHUDRAFT_118183 [Emiliania huxleyi CCMP1516]